ncbi:MAG: tetratricopeptide repeat protein [Armatimonadota bacterium]|nr:tetratricopeptide repeat protein [Armatimonadota bacterium]
MTNPMADELLSQLSQFLAQQMGLHYPPERWKDLRRGIESAAPDLGYADADDCIRWLLSTPLNRSQIETLASHLTVGETYFFRDRRSFEHLERIVLPQLIQMRAGSGRQIRVWSAGCCSGEEPYSLAMLLYKLIPDRSKWKITVLGTDVNPHFLEKAKRAVYTEWSFRGNPASMRDRFFTQVSKGQYELRAEIREMVTFRYLNLSEEAYPSLLNRTTDLDLILCRNVLIYFSAEGGQRVIDGFYRCLVPGGWLLVGASESSHVNDSAFKPVSFPDAIFYRKEAPVVRSTAPATPDRPVLRNGSGPALRGLEPGSRVIRRCGSGSPAAPPSEQQTKPHSAPEQPAAENTQDAYGEALELYRQGRTAEAAAKLEAFARGNGGPGSAPSYALLARINANAGKLNEALAWCDRAIALHKTEPSYRYLRATILQEQGNTDDAIASLNAAVYLNSDFVLAHFALGNLARQQGRFQEGDRRLENARVLLGRFSAEDELPEGEGLTAAQLSEVIASSIGKREPS